MQITDMMGSIQIIETITAILNRTIEPTKIINIIMIGMVIEMSTMIIGTIIMPITTHIETTTGMIVVIIIEIIEDMFRTRIIITTIDITTIIVVIAIIDLITKVNIPIAQRVV